MATRAISSDIKSHKNSTCIDVREPSSSVISVQSDSIRDSFLLPFTSICEVNSTTEENFETNFKNIKTKTKEYEEYLSSYLNDLESISDDMKVKEQYDQYKFINSKYQDIFSSFNIYSSNSTSLDSYNLLPVSDPLYELKKNLNNKNQKLLDEYLLEKEKENIKRNEEMKNLHNENIKLLSKLQDLKGNILVYTRVRPLLQSENKNESENPNVIDTFNNTTISIIDSKKVKYSCNITMDGPKAFEYDRCYNTESTQEEVFEDFKPLVGSLLKGYNVSIIAYGQTGSGKTYTMFGTKENKGLNYRLLNELFDKLNNNNNNAIDDYDIQISMVEIYNEKVIDLLKDSNSSTPISCCLSSPRTLNNNNIKNFETDIIRQSIVELNDLHKIIENGSKLRSTASTDINTHSSRSHCIITIYIKQIDKNGNKIYSKLYLVDLAGSERVSKSGVEGERLKEAQNINKSLSALGDVISALDNKQNHIPYRNSKLTMILKDSLSVNSKTVLLFNITPTLNSLSETLSSLNFASRVKHIEFGTIQKQIEYHDNEKEIKEIKKINIQIRNENDRLNEEIKNLKSQIKDCNNTKEDLNYKLLNELNDKNDILIAYKKKLKLLNSNCIKYKNNYDEMMKEKLKLEHEIENQSKIIKSFQKSRYENELLCKEICELKKRLLSLNKLENNKKNIKNNNKNNNNNKIKRNTPRLSYSTTLNNDKKLKPTISEENNEKENKYKNNNNNPHIFKFDSPSISPTTLVFPKYSPTEILRKTVIPSLSSNIIKPPTPSLLSSSQSLTTIEPTTTTTDDVSNTLKTTKSDYHDINNDYKYKFGQSLLFRRIRPNNKAPTPLFSDENVTNNKNKRSPPKLAMKGKKSVILNDVKSDENSKFQFSNKKFCKTVSHNYLMNNNVNKKVKFEYLKKRCKTPPIKKNT